MDVYGEKRERLGWEENQRGRETELFVLVKQFIEAF